MTNLTNDQRIKELQLQMEVQNAIQDLPPGAKKILLDQVVKTSAGRAHIFGTEAAPSADELVAELWATQAGRDLRELLDASESEAEPDSMEAQIAEINKLQGAAKINAARKLGLKY